MGSEMCIRDSIMVMGGKVGEEQELSASVITYDTEADAWGTAPPLPHPCMAGRATTIAGVIFLYNGSGGRVQYRRAGRNAEWKTVPGGRAHSYAAFGSVLLG